jgi:hypothetical protein
MFKDFLYGYRYINELLFSKISRVDFGYWAQSPISKFHKTQKPKFQNEYLCK